MKTEKIEKMEQSVNKIAKGKNFLKDNLWYGLIGVLSIVVLVVFPMIGSGLPLKLILPDTFIGWVVYVFSKIAIAVINICIFHGFMEQGKLNVSGYWKKILADEILHRVKQLKQNTPMSPEDWLRREYRNKGISIAVTSVLSSLVLSQVILTFDFIVFISFLLTLVIGLVFGVVALFKSEHFWSMDYYDYAIYIMDQHNAELDPEKRLYIKDKCLYEGDKIIYGCATET